MILPIVTRKPTKASGAVSCHRKKSADTSKIILVADLCCGMGGLSLAAQQLGMKVVAGVDLNSAALRTFKKNFPDAESMEGSVRSSKILSKISGLFTTGGVTLPSVIVSGPPCQGFSMAGSRNPSDPRNQILLAVARAITKLKPQIALIENVSMVLAEEHKKRLKNFERTLTRGDYFLEKVLLDASEFGVPQRRKRAFFLITKNKIDKDEFLRRLTLLKQAPVNTQTALRGLSTPTNRPKDYDDEADCHGVPNHFSMWHSKRVINKIALIKPGTGPMSYRRLHPLKPANTLFSGHRAPPAHFSEPRSITAREAARLQGFPDDFRIYGSFGKQMEQVTNAVPPPLAQVVLRTLVEIVALAEKDHG